MSKPKYPKMPQQEDNSPQAKETREEIRKIAYDLHMKGWTPTKIADELGLKNRGVVSTWKNRYDWPAVEAPRVEPVQQPAADPAKPRQKVLPKVPLPPALDTTATPPSSPTAAPAAGQPEEAPPATKAAPKRAGDSILVGFTPETRALQVPERIQALVDQTGLTETAITRMLIMVGLAVVATDPLKLMKAGTALRAVPHNP